MQEQSNMQAEFPFKLGKHNDVHIRQDDIREFCAKTNDMLDIFESTLKSSLEKWSSVDKRTSIVVYLPIDKSHLASVLAKHGFKYHHAENDEAVLFKWLDETRECKVPPFATHQVGVGGLVYRADTKQILLIKESHPMIADWWKLPGGCADLGESLEQASVREVFEETGIKTEFSSVLGFRQSHNFPGAYGRSDLYFVCRLEPTSFEINADPGEVKACEWHDLDKVIEDKKEYNSVLRMLAKVLKHGLDKGFDQIDMKLIEAQLMPGRTFKVFLRDINVPSSL